MATPEDGPQDLSGESISPKTKEKFNFLLEAVQSGRAHLQQDSAGRVKVVYANETRLPHVDPSKGHVIQTGKTAEDIGARVNVCLEMIEAIKANRAPSGVVLDSDAVKVSSRGEYAEGKQFERLQDVLGRGNCAGDIVVVKDNQTGAEQAVKTVMISEFSAHEVRAWVDLGEGELVPHLYLFYLKDNRVVFHMEKVQHGVTLDDIIDQHMANMWQNAPELIRPFSLCLFHGLLSVVRQMHDKNWAHNDLHGGNVMLTKDAMQLKVLDFGRARPLRGLDLGFDHAALKADVLNAIRLFTAAYAGQAFETNWDLEKQITGETLQQVLAETAPLDEAARAELVQLVAMTYQVTQNPTAEGYGDTSKVMDTIQHKIRPGSVNDVMKMAAAVLFPDVYQGDVDLKRGRDVVDCPGGGEEVTFDLEAAAAAVPDEFLEKFRISM